MDRRSVISGLAASAGTLLVPRPGFAQQTCAATGAGPFCESYIPLGKLAKIYAPQYMSEWCWAASISMVFAFNGHPVSQARIVNDAYGGIINMPGNYPALFGSLDLSWTDDNGDGFSVQIKRLFAPELGQQAMTDDDLIAELEAENPILYCTAQHAMVLTSITTLGSRVTEAWVMDPWPGRGLRRLMPNELRPIQYGGELRMAASLETI